MVMSPVVMANLTFSRASASIVGQYSVQRLMQQCLSYLRLGKLVEISHLLVFEGQLLVDRVQVSLQLCCLVGDSPMRKSLVELTV